MGRIPARDVAIFTACMKEELVKAMPYFNRAIEMDENFAEPHVGAGQDPMRRAMYMCSRSATQIDPDGMRIAKKALTIAERMQPAYYTLRSHGAFRQPRRRNRIARKHAAK